MDLGAVAGVSWPVAVVAVLVGVAAVLAVARVLARRSGRRERTLVSLNSRD